MESFPEDWVMQHLNGPLAFRGINYFPCRRIDQTDGKETEIFQCLLCKTKGYIKSEKSCLEHCRGRKHQRNYSFLVQQQKAWINEQSVPNSFLQGRHSCYNGYISSEDDEDVLDYFVPFRRWHFGKWEVGLSCQLCGTAAFPNRYAIVQHCESNRRHITLRNRTLDKGNYHPEITQSTNILQRIKQLPAKYYQWQMKRQLLTYLATKEAAMASLASRRYAWYQVWNTLETLELRYRLSFLECAIWKHHMLEYDEEHTFQSLAELEEFLSCYGLDYENYRMERRKTSQSTAIIIGVIPFLKQVSPTSDDETVFR